MLTRVGTPAAVDERPVEVSDQGAHVPAGVLLWVLPLALMEITRRQYKGRGGEEQGAGWKQEKLRQPVATRGQGQECEECDVASEVGHRWHACG